MNSFSRILAIGIVCVGAACTVNSSELNLCEKAEDRFAAEKVFESFSVVEQAAYDQTFKERAFVVLDCLTIIYETPPELYVALHSAANQGDEYATKLLGYLLLVGKYFDRDVEQGRALLRRISQIDAEAKTLLSVFGEYSTEHPDSS